MPDHGTPTGRDLNDHIMRRLDVAEAKMKARHGAAILSTFHRGDRNAVPAPVEGQTIIQHDTDVPYFYSNGSWRTFCTSGGGNTGLRVHIHQAVTGYNDGGLIHYTGRNLTQVSDAGASDSVAVEWAAPVYATFADVATDSNLFSGSGGANDWYEFQPTFCDLPFIDSVVDMPGDIMVTCRVRGTSGGTTYRMTFNPVPFETPNTDMTMVDGGIAETDPIANGDLYNTQTWTGTDYVNLTWIFNWVPTGPAAPSMYFFGWYIAGSGDVLLDKITMTWPF